MKTGFDVHGKTTFVLLSIEVIAMIAFLLFARSAAICSKLEKGHTTLRQQLFL